MGYTTEFEGSFLLDKPLKPEHAEYLKAFARTRRMYRDVVKAAGLSDPIREAAELPIGCNAEYFVGDTETSVLEHNLPPPSQPGLWCQWVPDDAGAAIEWDGGEKFYDYVEWLEYIVAHFLIPWGHTMNGSVRWDGEETGDTGTITATDNVIKAARDLPALTTGQDV